MNLFFRKGKWVTRNGYIPGPNCKDECCNGDGGPGPGDCIDPDNCYYELSRCRGVHPQPGQIARYFISLTDYQRAIDISGAPPGSCFWNNTPFGIGCWYIGYPTAQTAIPFAQIAPIVASGAGAIIGVFGLSIVLDNERSCCDGCGVGCVENDLVLGDGATPPIKCCCNMAGAHVTTVWSYSWKRRSTNVNDQNNWIQESITGGGTVVDYSLTSPFPTVRVHYEVGPTYPLTPPADFDLQFGHIASRGEGGCLGIINGYFSTVGDGVLADTTQPTRSCKTSRWSIVEHQDEIQCDSQIPPVCFRVVTDVIAVCNVTISEGSGDCGGGCFDSTSPVPLGARPLWVKALSKLATPEDRGLGDTITRVVGLFGGEVFKTWFKRTTGRDCACESRAAAFNAKYPFVK